LNPYRYTPEPDFQLKEKIPAPAFSQRTAPKITGFFFSPEPFQLKKIQLKKEDSIIPARG